jgi:hypothetical protein
MLNETDVRVQIPFKPGHYQFTFYIVKNNKRVWFRRIYKEDGKNMYDIHDIAKADALRDYPDSLGHVCHSPQCD